MKRGRGEDRPQAFTGCSAAKEPLSHPFQQKDWLDGPSLARYSERRTVTLSFHEWKTLAHRSAILPWQRF